MQTLLVLMVLTVGISGQPRGAVLIKQIPRKITNTLSLLAAVEVGKGIMAVVVEPEVTETLRQVKLLAVEDRQRRH